MGRLNKILENLKEWWYLKKLDFRHSKLGEAWYWLRCHTYNRYHILNMSNKDNGWDWGWEEPDAQILYANMAIMVQFVELECGFGDIGPDYEYVITAPADEVCDLHWQQSHAELIAIYKWWKYERKEEHRLQKEALEAHYKKYPYKMEFQRVDPDNGDSVYKRVPTEHDKEEELELDMLMEWEDELYQKDTDMLMRLMDIRSTLWQ